MPDTGPGYPLRQPVTASGAKGSATAAEREVFAPGSSDWIPDTSIFIPLHIFSVPRCWKSCHGAHSHTFKALFLMGGLSRWTLRAAIPSLSVLEEALLSSQANRARHKIGLRHPIFLSSHRASSVQAQSSIAVSLDPTPHTLKLLSQSLSRGFASKFLV